MYLFKTSGATYNSVIRNQKHAFKDSPKKWDPGEIVLVSKNIVDCGWLEKQIQYTMKIDNIRLLKPGETEKYWPGNEGRWDYIIECRETKHLVQPFNLENIIGPERYEEYHGVMTFKRLEPCDEILVIEFINKVGTY